MDEYSVIEATMPAARRLGVAPAIPDWVAGLVLDV